MLIHKQFKFYLITVIILLFLSSCKKTEPALECTDLGFVKDYTGLDGCGLLIVLDDGRVLEPQNWDAFPDHFDGQRISCSFIESGNGSFCMAGEVVELTCFSDVGPYQIIEDDIPYFEYPTDEYDFNQAEVLGDRLMVSVSYAGGCKHHKFYFVETLPFCGTPPEPPPFIQLYHDANNENCEAYVTEILSLDIFPLRKEGQDTIVFYLLTGSDQHEFVYRY